MVNKEHVCSIQYVCYVKYLNIAAEIGSRGLAIADWRKASLEFFDCSEISCAESLSTVVARIRLSCGSK